MLSIALKLKKQHRLFFFANRFKKLKSEVFCKKSHNKVKVSQVSQMSYTLTTLIKCKNGELRIIQINNRLITKFK